MHILALLFCYLMLLTAPLYAATFYVGQTATGAGTGTSTSNLCGGLADADCTPAAGDTVYLCGAFTSRQTAYAVNGTSGNVITYDFDCSGNPATLTLDAATNEGVYINGRSYLTLANARVTGATLGTASPAALIVVNNSSYITINDSDTYNNADATRGHGLVCMTCSYVTINRPISRGNVGHGILIVNGAGTTSHHNTITAFLTYDNRRSGVIMEGPSGSQDRVYDNLADEGTSYGNGDGMYALHGTNNTFSNNHVYSNTNTLNGSAEGYGIAIQENLNATVEGNEIHANRTDGIEVWGSVTESSNNCRVRYNTVYGHTLFTADDSGSNGIEERTGYAAGCYLYGNLVYGNTRNFRIGNDSAGTSILASNTISGGAYGIKMVDSNEAGTNATTGWVIINNIFSGQTSRWMETEVAAANSNTFAKNDWAGSSGAVYNGVTYTPGTITTVDSTGLTADPVFMSEAASDYRLAVASTLRRAGLAKYLCADARGRVCPPDAPHIGAYQSTSGDPAATRAVRN